MYGLFVVFQDGIDVGVLDFVVGNFCCGVVQYQLVELFVGVDVQLLVDQVVYGQFVEMYVWQFEGIEQGKYVGVELVDGVWFGGDQ